MFSLLKKNINLLLSTNTKDYDVYKNVKIILIKCIKDRYLKMNNPSIIMRKTVADSLTLVIISGICFHWPTCIKDLINESTKGNLEFCYIILRALGSIDLLIHYGGNLINENYADSIIISEKDKLLIKEKLIENKDIVIKFLLNIYNNINNFKNENSRQMMIKQLFETTKCWTNFGLNILKSISISKMIYNIVGSNNIADPRNFSEMICESINLSNNAKVYKDIEVEINSTPEELSQKLIKKIDLDEKKGLDELVTFLLPKLDELKNKNYMTDNYIKELITEYGKILAAIIENFIYLFFNFNDKKSEMILSLFNYFLKCKIRNISTIFFEGVDEMRDFINNFYRFAGLNEQQIVDFVNYLMDIVYGIMENCSYKKLDQNDISLLKQEILNRNNNLNVTPPDSLYTKNEQNLKDKDNYCDLEDMDINQYRVYASSPFYSIFFILIENFRDPGTSQFLNKILSSLPISEINLEKNLNSELFAIKTDVVLFVISSIIEIFQVDENAPFSINIIHDLIKTLLSTKLIYQNQRIFIDFIVLINKFTPQLILKPDNFINVAKFLILVSKNSNNPDIVQSCYIVLLNACNEINDDIKFENSFILEIFNLYQEIYNKYKYPNITPLENIIDIILKIVGINKNRIPKNTNGPKTNNDYDQNLKNILQQITFPINNKIKMILDNAENNSLNTTLKNDLKFEILKGYYLQKKIIKSLKEFSYALKNDFLQEHLNITLNLTQKIFELFQNDKNLIDPLIDFYTENAEDIGSCYNQNFDLLNQILINYFLSSSNHFYVLETLKAMYLSFLMSKDKTDKQYMPNNKFILEQYYLIMSNFINNISKDNNIDSNIKEKIKYISEFHCLIFHKLNINSSSIINNEELIKYYNLIQNVIYFFINCIKLFQNLENTEPVEEITLFSILKSFNSFFINISISKEFFLKNNNNSCIFIDIVLTLWNIIIFKKFNCLSRSKLIGLYINMIEYDTNLFNIAFEKCISQCQKFPPVYIKSIIEYIQCFNDNKDNLKKMLELIIETVPASANIDNMAFNKLLSLVVKKKGLKKIIK